MKQLWRSFWSIVLVIGILTGCSAGGNSEETASNDQQAQTEEKHTDEQSTKESDQSDAEDTYPLTITDALENEVTFEDAPSAIVSTIPSNGEILFALGLTDEVVGVSDYANYPEEATTKEKIGGQDLNVEKILSLQPDLVLAHASGAHNSEQALEQIRNAGVAVFVVQDASSFAAVYESIETIGKITGKGAEAEEIVTTMRDDLNSIKEKASTIPEEEQKNVFVEVSPAPDIYTSGQGTFLHEMLQAIHAKNVVGDKEGWFKVNNEAIVEMQPDVIVTTYGYYTENPKEKVLSRDGWGSVPAIQNEHVYDVHSDLVTRSGPRLIKGVRELAKAIYPDVFNE